MAKKKMPQFCAQLSKVGHTHSNMGMKLTKSDNAIELGIDVTTQLAVGVTSSIGQENVAVLYMMDLAMAILDEAGIDMENKTFELMLAEAKERRKGWCLVDEKSGTRSDHPQRLDS